MLKSRLYFVTIPILYIFLASPVFFYEIFNQSSYQDRKTASCIKFQQALIIPFVSNNNDDKSERGCHKTSIHQHNKHKRYTSIRYNIDMCICYIAYVYVCVRIYIRRVQRWWGCRRCRSDFRVRLYCANFILTLANIM